MTSSDDDVLIARAYLSRVSEPASLEVWRFVNEVGAIAAARAIANGDAPNQVRSQTAARAKAADPLADLDAAERIGVRLVVPESPDWPHWAIVALESAGADRVARYDAGERRSADQGEPIPPLALWVRGNGDLASLGLRSVALVGSRAASSYGEHVTTKLAYDLADKAVPVVSGGAYGIDAAAHRGALAAGGETVIVSAAGLDRAYPAGNARLFDQVAESGLVISESPPGSAPQRHRFLLRNRLIAAFSTGTVVVEAAHRSGAMNTAGHCVRLGRPLMAVPGPITSAMSRGCHDLLRWESKPATLVTSADDILGVVGAVGEGLDLAPAAAADGVRSVLDSLDAIARRVLDGLPARRYASPDEIALRSGVAANEVFRWLPGLQLAGLVDASDAGFRASKALKATTQQTLFRSST